MLLILLSSAKKQEFSHKINVSNTRDSVPSRFQTPMKKLRIFFELRGVQKCSFQSNLNLGRKEGCKIVKICIDISDT